MQKFEISDRVKNTERFRSITTKEIVIREKSGTIIDIKLPGESYSINKVLVMTGTSKGKETRYRIKWDNAPRTWMRESALVKI